MNTNFLVINNILATLFLASTFLVSCDDDISEVGTNVLVGSEITTLEEDNFSITSGQIDVTQPQTNNLDFYLIGDNDHGFGNTKYSILTQINSYSVLVQESYTEVTDEDVQDEDGNDEILTTTDVSYELESATLVIPFRYNLEDDEDVIDDDSTTTQYNIESLISGSNLEISVYESNYELQTTNPNSTTSAAQVYYGNISTEVNELSEAQIKGDLITTFQYTLPSTDDEFTVDLYYDEDDDGEEDDEYSDEGVSNQFPAIRIPLDDYKDHILEIIRSDENKDEDKVGDAFDEINDIDLSVITEENFTSDIFRGIYIETTSEDGVTEILDFDESFVNAGIQLVFTKTTTYNDFDGNDDDDSSTDAETDTEVTVEEIITTLQFSESPINILTKTSETETLPTIEIGENNQDEIILQSGLGRIGTIDLFSESDEENSTITLAELHEDDILLNDAVLKLTVNTSSEFYIDDESLPENIFITELENGDTLLDYISNFSISDDDNETLKEGHLLSLVTPSDNDSFEPYYEINITEHLSNVLRQDEDDSDDSEDANITLALSVTQNLNITDSSDLYNPNNVWSINQGTLLCFKTVPLYGSSYGDDANLDDLEKRPRLTIKYTSTSTE